MELIDLRAGLGVLDRRDVQALACLPELDLRTQLVRWGRAADAVGAGLPLLQDEDLILRTCGVPDRESDFYGMLEDGGEDVFDTLRTGMQAAFSADSWRNIGLHGGARSGRVHESLGRHCDLLVTSAAYARTALDAARRALQRECRGRRAIFS